VRASETEAIAFEPEALTMADFEALSQSVLARLDSISAALRLKPTPLGDEVLGSSDLIRTRIGALGSLKPGTMKTRHHGDYHLGQVLDTGDDWIIIDFEGEPLRPLPERRAKRSPLRDVAGMLRSLHYAPHAARPDAEESTLAKAEAWTDAARASFLDRYFAVAQGAPFLPDDEGERQALLDAYLLEKALYEIDYELNNRPDWLPIPLRGVLKVIRRA
jgi:maltose alpha-D-glucosyltransferase / alpha-amylase